ncbi:TPA: hypothetical protein PXP91_004311 [Yersinia enterocolitica]|nr:hypothetical protein [Yersinia enterocolitica]HDL7955600.1 hypothetical protein [Yersinia enterocolitica]
MKRILLVGCFLLLAAAIWFLGPFLGFGEARPLEGYEPRIIFLLLALALLLGFWFNVPQSSLLLPLSPFFMVCGVLCGL